VSVVRLIGRVFAVVTRTWPGRIGLALSSVIVLAGLVSLVWTPHDPTKIEPLNKWQPLSWTHPFGTDGGGKDLFSQVLVGARTTLTVVVLTVLLSAVIGVILGVLSSVTPRLVGESVAHVIDIVIALPTLILALVLLAALGGSVWTVSLALGIGSGVVLARVVKGEVARVQTQDYVLAASASGSSTLRTVVRHVFPNIAPVIIVQLSLIAALAVLSEAALSYLGLTPVSTPSWGRMLEQLQGTASVHPWSILFPGLAVVAATLGFNLLGDGLRDAVDPRLRSTKALPTVDLTGAVSNANTRQGTAP
jgi:peptide/nickel transport system permease protein